MILNDKGNQMAKEIRETIIIAKGYNVDVEGHILNMLKIKASTMI